MKGKLLLRLPVYFLYTSLISISKRRKNSKTNTHSSSCNDSSEFSFTFNLLRYVMCTLNSQEIRKDIVNVNVMNDMYSNF